MKLENRLETIDKKERVNKNRIVPELEELVKIYSNLSWLYSLTYIMGVSVSVWTGRTFEY